MVESSGSLPSLLKALFWKRIVARRKVVDALLGADSAVDQTGGTGFADERDETIETLRRQELRGAFPP
jgi:molybdopterin biosynthesis enzyme MoaB